MKDTNKKSKSFVFRLFISALMGISVAPVYMQADNGLSYKSVIPKLGKVVSQTASAPVHATVSTPAPTIWPNLGEIASNVGSGTWDVGAAILRYAAKRSRGLFKDTSIESKFLAVGLTAVFTACLGYKMYRWFRRPSPLSPPSRRVRACARADAHAFIQNED